MRPFNVVRSVLVSRGARVKSLRFLLVLMIIGLSTSVALADSADPALGVRGGSDNSLWTGSITFTIDSDTSTCAGGLCNFISDSFYIDEGTITNFELDFNTEQGGFTTLEGSAFVVTTLEQGFKALLSGGTILPCGEAGQGEGCLQEDNQIFGAFEFVMNGVVDGSTVMVTSNVATPEPGTLILLLSGLGVMGLRRLGWNKVPS